MVLLIVLQIVIFPVGILWMFAASALSVLMFGSPPTLATICVWLFTVWLVALGMSSNESSTPDATIEVPPMKPPRYLP